MTLLKILTEIYIKELLNQISNLGKQQEESLSEIKAQIRTKFVNALISQYTLRSSSHLRQSLSLANRLSHELIRALGALGFRTVIVDARLSTLGLVGVSQGVLKAVFEVGMSWNHILDLPMIPGSSIKGAVRGIVERLLLSKYCNENHECFKYVEVLFGVGGHEGWTGLLLFFDAYPIDVKNDEGTLLEPDIVSPHYMHGTEVIPFERLVEPVPVPHVSIAPGVVFRFIVAAEPSADVEEALKGLMSCFGKSYPGFGSAIASLLLTAFRYGVGARTSRGYGKFEIERMLIDIDGRKLTTPILFEPFVKRQGRVSRKGGRR